MLLLYDEEKKILVVYWVILLIVFLVFVFRSNSLDVRVSVVEEIVLFIERV